MKILHSIRWKINIFQILLLLCVVVSLLSLHYHLTKKELLGGKDMELQNLLMVTMPAIAPMPLSNLDSELDRRMPQSNLDRGPNRGMPQPDSDNGPDRRMMQDRLVKDTEESQEVLNNILAKSLYIVVWNENGLEENRYGDVPASLTFNTYKKIPESQFFVTRDGNRELVVQHRDRVIIVLGGSLSEIYKQLSAVQRNVFLIGFAIIFLGIVVGWFLSGEILRPIKEISKTAKEITSGDHRRRIELSDAPTELTTLATALNSSFDHFEDVIEAQTRFSADASHELRTPISVVIAQTQTALKKERTIGEYKSVIEACLRAGQRMKSMANSLLDLHQSETIKKSECDLNELLQNTFDVIKDLSDKHEISFVGLDKSLLIEIDSERIRQVVMNLISNAISHNPDGCKIFITLEEEDNQAIIKVADSGVGIPKRALTHVFERFYRVDKSRSRANGGAGLGLSIVKSIVDAHGGTIEASSVIASGATFTINLACD
jgi:heavy metal sensor kinase